MNATELATILTFIGCTISAGLVAGLEKAGWFTILFIAIGILLGFGFAWAVNKLANSLLDISDQQTKASWGWTWLLAYTLVPLLVAFIAMALTGWVTFRLVKQIL